jgi:hypothetical protein
LLANGCPPAWHLVTRIEKPIRPADDPQLVL